MPPLRSEYNRKTQWNNPWLLPPHLVFWRFLSGVISLSSWVLSLVNLAFCSLRFHFPFVLHCFREQYLLTHHFFCISYAFASTMHSTLYERKFGKFDRLLFWGRLTCTLVSPLLSCPGPFVWCLPLCDYNITQVFAICKMAYCTKYASLTCATCRKCC